MRERERGREGERMGFAVIQSPDSSTVVSDC
jgi:hypothetical protein